MTKQLEGKGQLVGRKQRPGGLRFLLSTTRKERVTKLLKTTKMGYKNGEANEGNSIELEEKS